MDIVYVGLKEMKGDNIAGTGLTWTRGQVQKVEDEKKAAMLIRYELIWRDATGKTASQIQALLLQPPAEVPAQPRVSIIPEGKRSSFSDPYVVVVPEDIFNKLRTGDLKAVFLTDDTFDQFERWKLAQHDTAPKNTGPRKKEGDPLGLPTKAGLEATKKSA